MDNEEEMSGGYQNQPIYQMEGGEATNNDGEEVESEAD